MKQLKLVKTTQKATANIIMRLTPEQKNKMVANAQKNGKSLTQFVLSRCL